MVILWFYKFRMLGVEDHRCQRRHFHQGKVSCCVHDAMGFGFSGVIDYARGDYKPPRPKLRCSWGLNMNKHEMI
jgi:hypothetical protein